MGVKFIGEDWMKRSGDLTDVFQTSFLINIAQNL